MRFSEAFGLEKKQAELDFVDIELTGDIPLFVDPFALSIGKDEWSYECTQHIVSFFQTAIDAIHANDHARAKGVLTNLSEPNETRLGLSKARPNGRGVSGKQAFDLYEALVDSDAAKTGVLAEIAECDLFIPGIGADKISDITTNVIRGPLTEYTRRQCELHGIDLQQDVPAGKFWDLSLLDWAARYARLPTWQNRQILLVPKASVRFRMGLDSHDYYNNFVLNYLQAEHLSANSALVKVLKSGERYVTKKSLREVTPFSKEELYHFTKAHPEVLERYKKLRREHNVNAEKIDPEFDESDFSDAIASSLRDIPPGNEAAGAFHKLMIGVLEFIFFPNLIYPVKEAEIHDGRKRIDISYTNAAQHGFFYRVHTAHQIASTRVMVECKNYSKEIANPELDQISGRFSPNRGKLGLLIARSCENPGLFIERCRDTARDGRGFVIPLFDDDMLQFLDSIKQRRRQDIDAKLEGIFGKLIQ